MKISRRNCVFVAHSNNVGHELIFRHYTNKVVVGHHSHSQQDLKKKNTAGKKTREARGNSFFY